jgi:hypothetical protein
MLPQVYQQRYQEFQQALEQLRSQVSQAQIDGVTLRTGFLHLQQFFQLQIAPLDDDLDPVEVQRVRSYNTEIHKQLRLLGMDVSFLQAARQSITAQQRQRQMGDRLETLIGYCQALLVIPSDPDSASGRLEDKPEV